MICPYAKDDDKLSLCDLIKKIQFETIPDIYNFFIDEMKNSVFETLPVIATFGTFLANIVFPMIYFYFFIIASCFSGCVVIWMREYYEDH